MYYRDYDKILTCKIPLPTVKTTDRYFTHAVFSFHCSKNSPTHAGGGLDRCWQRTARLHAWRTRALALRYCRMPTMVCQVESWRISGRRQTGVSGKAERSCRHPRHQLGTSRRSSRPIRRSRIHLGRLDLSRQKTTVCGNYHRLVEANRRNLEDAARRRQ